MIFRHTVLSSLKDLKNFNNITAARQRLFDSTAPTVPQPARGANKTAARLHPEKQGMKFVSFEQTADGIFFTLEAAEEKPAFYRAGQYVNVDCPEGLYPAFFAENHRDDRRTYTLYAGNGSPVCCFIMSLSAGDEVTVGAPVGTFTYQPLRDNGDVLFFADGSGLGAAMAFRDDICASFPETEMTVVLIGTSGAVQGEGIIRADSVEGADIAAAGKSVFVCGEKNICSAVSDFYPDNNVRKCVTALPEKNSDGSFTCTVMFPDRTQTVVCEAGRTLAFSLEKAGIKRYDKCLNGECGFCRARLIGGKVTSVYDFTEDGRRAADKKFGYIHPCRAFPESDITIKF